MPQFEHNPLELLAPQTAEAEADLDLRGLQTGPAMQRVSMLLAERGPAGSYRILFDPPAGDGAETLFQPLGRVLLAARRQGLLQSCLPLQHGMGYFIAFHRPPHSDRQDSGAEG